MTHMLVAIQKVVDGSEFWDITFGGFRISDLHGNEGPNHYEQVFLYDLRELKFKLNENTGEMTLRHRKEADDGEPGHRTRAATGNGNGAGIGTEFRGSAPPLALIQRIVYRLRKFHNVIGVSTSSHVDSQTGLATYTWTIA